MVERYSVKVLDWEQAFITQAEVSGRSKNVIEQLVITVHGSIIQPIEKAGAKFVLNLHPTREPLSRTDPTPKIDVATLKKWKGIVTLTAHVAQESVPFVLFGLQAGMFRFLYVDCKKGDWGAEYVHSYVLVPRQDD